MRLIMYYVIEKETNRKVYVNCWERKARAYLATLPNADRYVIGYKWMSV